MKPLRSWAWKGLASSVAVHLFVAGFGFVYLYPFLYMVANAFMSTTDIVNPLVRWLPSSLYLDNFAKAWQALDVAVSLPTSILLSSALALAQTASSALIGYGLARFHFRGRRLLFALVLLTIVVSPAITLIPRYMLFDALGWTGTPLPLLLPALLGQGLNGGLFILIFHQFFSQVPRVLDEAAEIDGAGKLALFLKIALPVSTPALVVSLIFSLVWNWNETFNAAILLGGSLETLPIKLTRFVELYYQQNPMQWGSTANRVNEGLRLAGTLLAILPLLVAYFFLQRRFVESVDRSGITGE